MTDSTFHLNAYIHRKDAEEIYREWLDGIGPVLTVTGAPKIGKTWFLRYIESNASQRGYHTVSLQAEQIFSSSENDLNSVTESVTAAKSKRSSFPIANLKDSDLSARAENITEYLRRGEGAKFLILLDFQNADIPEKLSELLNPFIRAAKRLYKSQRLRVVIGHRKRISKDIYEIQLFRENKNIKLDVFNEDEAEEYFTQLTANISDLTSHSIYRQIRECGYHWEYPFLNDCLADAIKNNEGSFTDNIKNCLLEVFGRRDSVLKGLQSLPSRGNISHLPNGVMGYLKENHLSYYEKESANHRLLPAIRAWLCYFNQFLMQSEERSDD